VKTLDRCAACGGFVPFTKTSCVHCGAGRAARRLKALGATIGGGAIAFTLMACYGRPQCKDGTQDCYRTPPASADDAANPAPKSADAAPPTSGVDAGK
jgi:hypothetical protein